MSSRKPKLIVFDLDWTLWPFHVDTNVDPPFTRLPNGNIIDQRKREIEHFPEVPKILERLVSEGYQVAVASRTGEIKGAEQLLQLFDWNKYFSYKEIYPGCKKTHFSKFKKNSGFDYSEMLFFDDEYRNIRDLVSVGVCSILVDEGVDSSVIADGLKKYAEGKLQ
ncbi:magnesium-dependent phosphatase 1-like [Neocloeon triangulifer]|uniref:magnesium-dependent phosphatase 1-like n=1 Tax=Neocloeon triangulifer TaxID=2078957 RepID=UPI00286FA454|nr:magnesium-dependent phosphatase 1-like [Neocloeon triangulifer]